MEVAMSGSCYTSPADPMASSLLTPSPVFGICSALPQMSHFFMAHRAKVQRGGKPTQCPGCGGVGTGEKRAGSPQIWVEPGSGGGKRDQEVKAGPTSPLQSLSGASASWGGKLTASLAKRRTWLCHQFLLGPWATPCPFLGLVFPFCNMKGETDVFCPMLTFCRT